MVTTTSERTATGTAGSTRITVPANWVQRENVKNGDKLFVICDRCMMVMTNRPMSDKDINDMMTNIRLLVEMKVRERGKMP